MYVIEYSKHAYLFLLNSYLMGRFHVPLSKLLYLGFV